ncbi:unnamed protein product [Somion occarium]|uniref:Copper acquisition factor BIM1-like domain-containing protein n=1 Tax=Somion occarium TaxID=3059160 RepID=A0ABP1CR00_9APHY
MRFTSLVFLSGLSTLVSAHFRLQYPEPRGVFVADQEPTFCDGYNTAASNRSEFPLSGGFVSIDAHHPKYTIGVLVSTAQNPSSFDNFTTAVNFFPFEGTGPLCFPIDLNSTGVDGIRDGANVTLQVVFDGGDGNLYQTCRHIVLRCDIEQQLCYTIQRVLHEHHEHCGDFKFRRTCANKYHWHELCYNSIGL